MWVAKKMGMLSFRRRKFLWQDIEFPIEQFEFEGLAGFPGGDNWLNCFIKAGFLLIELTELDLSSDWITSVGFRMENYTFCSLYGSKGRLHFALLMFFCFFVSFVLFCITNTPSRPSYPIGSDLMGLTTLYSQPDLITTFGIL